MAEVDKDKFTQIKPREEIGKQLEPAKENKPKPEKSKMKQGVVEKKPTFGERIANNFMNIDYEGIKDRLLFDWLFPEIISTLGDVLRMIFSQDGRGSSRSSARRNGMAIQSTAVYPTETENAGSVILLGRTFVRLRWSFTNERTRRRYWTTCESGLKAAM